VFFFFIFDELFPALQHCHFVNPLVVSLNQAAGISVMSRIIFKGGAWSNKEDALLQAALAKYGMKNWDRVASMLENRKTPQQCKDRWYMYLDPSVNKGEWTSDEEDKLVQLQELFPAQWELIASQIKGRMAWQCEQHYHALVESAGGVANVAPDALIAELRNRRMQQGGGASGSGVATFDSAFETRAPRADAVDLDGKEQEMMATATARLANQDGKKQSRESRQQQLKETTFLTTLQRGREMEASGTLSHTAKRRRQSALSDMISNQGSGAPREGDDEGDDGADGFMPVEVIQSSARRTLTKKNSLVMTKGITSKPQDDDESFGQDGSSTGGVDLAHLFSPSVPAVGGDNHSTAFSLSAIPPSSSIALDWSVLGEATGSLLPAPPTIVPLQEAKFAAPSPNNEETDVRPQMSRQNVTSVAVDAFDAPLRYDEFWKNAAQALINEECDSVTIASYSEQELKEARALVQQTLDAVSLESFDALSDLAHVHSDKKSQVSPISYRELQSRDIELLTSSSQSKRQRENPVGADDEAELARTAAAVGDERVRTADLQLKLWFYKHVCLPAEAIEIKRRITAVSEKLDVARQREASLQNEFAQACHKSLSKRALS
jgi:hypothetical protein